MKISITVETTAIKKLCILLFWLFVWELCSLFIGNSLILPSPFEVIKTLFILARGTYFWKSVFSSIVRVILGILISIVIGIVLGV
ncbi:MAG TPA: ABC transporter permease, partial [Clostridium sp.]|nr:ABC transporter permease [Clostridium sp.]